MERVYFKRLMEKFNKNVISECSGAALRQSRTCFNRRSMDSRLKISGMTQCTGFTLIELMLVVIIIGALVAMVLPRLAGRSEQARTQAALADINSNIATGLKLYELDNGSFPSSSEGLNALLTKPGNAKSWNGPYLEKKPIDPWGRDYKYDSPGSHRPSDYDLYSIGKDGQAGTADDVNNWS